MTPFKTKEREHMILKEYENECEHISDNLMLRRLLQHLKVGQEDCEEKVSVKARSMAQKQICPLQKL